MAGFRLFYLKKIKTLSLNAKRGFDVIANHSIHKQPNKMVKNHSSHQNLKNIDTVVNNLQQLTIQEENLSHAGEVITQSWEFFSRHRYRLNNPTPQDPLLPKDILETLLNKLYEFLNLNPNFNFSNLIVSVAYLKLPLNKIPFFTESKQTQFNKQLFETIIKNFHLLSPKEFIRTLSSLGYLLQTTHADSLLCHCKQTPCHTHCHRLKLYDVVTRGLKMIEERNHVYTLHDSNQILGFIGKMQKYYKWQDIIKTSLYKKILADTEHLLVEPIRSDKIREFNSHLMALMPIHNNINNLLCTHKQKIINQFCYFLENDLIDNSNFASLFKHLTKFSLHATSDLSLKHAKLLYEKIAVILTSPETKITDVINICWSLAVLDLSWEEIGLKHLENTIKNLLQEKFVYLKNNEFIQFNQVSLYYGWKISQSASEKIAQVAKENLQTTTSKWEQEVTSTIKNIAPKFSIRTEVLIGNFKHADICLWINENDKNLPLIIELHGSLHYDQHNNLRLKDQFNRRLMEKMGYKVYTISQIDWEKAENKEEFLKQRLREAKRLLNTSEKIQYFTAAKRQASKEAIFPQTKNLSVLPMESIPKEKNSLSKQTKPTEIRINHPEKTSPLSLFNTFHSPSLLTEFSSLEILTAAVTLQLNAPSLNINLVKALTAIYVSHIEHALLQNTPKPGIKVI